MYKHFEVLSSKGLTTQSIFLIIWGKGLTLRWGRLRSAWGSRSRQSTSNNDEKHTLCGWTCYSLLVMATRATLTLTYKATSNFLSVIVRTSNKWFRSDNLTVRASWCILEKYRNRKHGPIENCSYTERAELSIGVYCTVQPELYRKIIIHNMPPVSTSLVFT